MKISKFILTIIFSILIISCSKNEKFSVITEKNIEYQMIEAFNEGYDELKKGDALSHVFTRDNGM